MSSPAEPLAANDGPESSRDPAIAREVAAWVTLLFRAVKTCRLYDAANPTVARFRQELADTTGRLLDRCGTLHLEIKSSEMRWEGESVFQAHSRDENLPGIFHRDGVRALTLMPGIGDDEVQGLVNGILSVTGPTPVDDDLVTILWEANLPHVQVSAVPLEGDVDGGDEGAESSEEGSLLPWPGATATATAPAGGSAHAMGGATRETDTRSDDWDSVDGAADPETVFAELESQSAEYLSRLEREHQEARALPMVGSATAILADAFDASATPEDRAELAAFVPRLLREATAQGEWRAAAEALRLGRAAGSADPTNGFLEAVRAPGSTVTPHAVAALDRQDDDGLEAFVEFAEALGAPAADWLMTVLAESQRRRVRQHLVNIVANLARERPETLLPWLSDERWYVVRNVVHIYSRIGGGGSTGFIQAVLKHPEARVRREVVDVLGKSDPATARPMLIAMLEGSEPRVYAAILQRLSQDPHPEVTKLLLAALAHDTFSRRTDEEKRAILVALATRGDAVLPALVEELNRGGLFSRGDDAHRHALAFCIARLGTPAARAALEQGARNGKPGVRKACALALGSKGGANG